MASYDGSINLDVRVSRDDFFRGINEIKSAIRSLQSVVESINSKIGTTTRANIDNINNGINETKDNVQQVSDSMQQFDGRAQETAEQFGNISDAAQQSADAISNIDDSSVGDGSGMREAADAARDYADAVEQINDMDVEGLDSGNAAETAESLSNRLKALVMLLAALMKDFKVLMKVLNSCAVTLKTLPVLKDRFRKHRHKLLTTMHRHHKIEAIPLMLISAGS